MRFVSRPVCATSLLLVFALVTIHQPTASAAPYIGQETFTYRQPDGSTFSVKLYGDEFFAYAETVSGRVIVLDAATKSWCYARLAADGRSFGSTGIPVVTKTQDEAQGALLAAQANVSPKLRLPSDVVLAKIRAAQNRYRVDSKGRPLGRDPGAAKGPPSTTTTGTYVGLCLLVDFSDEPGTIATGDVDNYFNQANGYTDNSNACSVREYFDIQSGGLLDYSNVVTAYVRMSRPKTYYDDNTAWDEGTNTPEELVVEALDILMAQSFDFTPLSLDASDTILCINVFYAGTVASGWSLGLWPHSSGIPAKEVDAANGIYASRYQMTDMGDSLRIGTVCHENGHMLCGFPDLYSYIPENPAVVGQYSLMASGNHADGGRHPVNVDPYLKTAAGWATVTDLDSTDCLTGALDATDNAFYRYRNSDNSQEYFMFEVRASAGYEAPYGGSSSSVNPASGVVAYHILETGSNTHSTITNAPDCDYSSPYELLVLESNPPYNGAEPWYLAPSPNSSDAFFNGGVDALNASTLPALSFWTGDGRTAPSALSVTAISAAAADMTFQVGRAAGEVFAIIEPPSAAAAGAQWQLDGGAWHDSGDAVSGLASGDYTLSFSDAFGWTTPPDEAITVGGSCGEVIVGAYTQAPISLPLALNAPELVWNTNGDALWYGQRADAHDGYASGQSGDVDDAQQTALDTTVTGPGTLRFWWRVSSELDYDYLTFSVDTSPEYSISGGTPWALVEHAIPAGSHTVKWDYEKDPTLSSGQDCGWVDEVSFIPDGSPSGSLLVNIVPAAAASAGAQWRLDGGAWQDSEVTLNLLSAGPHTVSFGYTLGWSAPADIPVTIADTLATQTATYLAAGEVNVITANLVTGFIEEGMTLTLTAPLDGTGYSWTRNGSPVTDDPPRLTGAATNVLTFDTVLQTDAGAYIASRETGAKAILPTLPYALSILPPNSIPVASIAALGALAAALGLAGIRVAARRKR